MFFLTVLFWRSPAQLSSLLSACSTNDDADDSESKAELLFSTFVARPSTAATRFLTRSSDASSTRRPLPIASCRADDVYAFGVILYEILEEDYPFQSLLTDGVDAAALLDLVLYDRLSLAASDPRAPLAIVIAPLLDECVLFDASLRPRFTHRTSEFDCIATRVRCAMLSVCFCICGHAANPPLATLLLLVYRKLGMCGTTTSFMDAMLQRMSYYVHKLEELVAEHTLHWAEEKNNTEVLLYSLLPPNTAAQMMSGLPPEPTAYESVTVVGWTG